MSTQIRMPEELHAQLSEMARRQYRSLNSLMVYLLAEAAEREEDRERERREGASHDD
ncbi:MAG TPA: Arc family DNA-binding protein [Chloroflexota bacterium]|nr:Arc family DNA-binding protein [Chloroflexota bacterium]